MASKIITLEAPVEYFGKSIASVTLREPTGGEYAIHGEPFIVVRNIDGTWYVVEQPNVIKAYLDRCLDVENGSAILGTLTLKDAKRIKEVLLGFFMDAAEPISSPDATS